MIPAVSHGGASHRSLPWAFGSIAALFVLSTMASIFWADRAVRESHLIAENMLVSVELVSRISRDLDLGRILVSEHIFAKESADMGAIERRISEVDRDLVLAMRAYDPIANLPGEPAVWQRLQAQIAGLKGPLAEALSLSSRNMDAEAHEAASALEGWYQDIDGDVTQLIQINRAGGNDAVIRIDGLKQTSMTLFSGVGVIGLLATALVGAWSSRRMQRSEDQLHRNASELRERNEELEITSWVRTRQTVLSERIQGDLLVAELGARSLGALAEATGADVGAFWVGDGAGYRLAAGHALDGSGPKHFGNGEGLVGQVAEDRQLRHLRDVPCDFLRVKAATGERNPVEVVLVPAHADGETHAVVELGFLRHVEKRGLDLLSRVGETLAVAVRSTAYRTRLGELLEESRQQAEELQTQQEELRVPNEELLAQGDNLRAVGVELEKRGAELEMSNASLARANRHKSEFLANMSHELRTPLNSTLILANLLAANATRNLTEEQVKFAETIHSAGTDLLALIESILDLSKIEAGKVDPNITMTTLERVVEPVIKMFDPIARERGLAFVASLSDRSDAFATDVQRVQQILKNLLSNAFKFTDHGDVSLSAQATDDSVSFVVRDTGIGIPVDQQQVIFEAFRQADGAGSRRAGGTGLGLSISLELAKRLGGDIRVTSSEGEGSTFTFSIPRRRTQAIGLGKPSVEAGLNGSVARHVPSATPAFADDRERLDGTRSVLLIVEDDVPFAEVIAKLATEIEFQYLVAHRADEGVRIALQHAPSAIVLDLNLPDYSGLSVIDQLKRHPATRHIPIHVISALDQASTALSMGAIGYLRKPVTRDALVATLRRLKSQFDRMRRLLIVEDDHIQRDAIERLLDATEVEIVSVPTVTEALAHLRTSTFDCVVTDLALADGTGYDLLEQMAGNEAYSFPPVIVYTARSLTAEEEQRLLSYSTSIIVKGARSPERLLDEVTLFLHQVEAKLPEGRRRMLELVRDRDAAIDGQTILVAEDDVRNIFALTKILEPKGAKLLFARNGREAVEIVAQAQELDLVLMDIMMPEMDGLQAIEEIRRLGGRRSEVPIIALTAKAMPDDHDRCRAAGANDYIAKPLDVAVLLSLVRVWIRR